MNKLLFGLIGIGMISGIIGFAQSQNKTSENCPETATCVCCPCTADCQPGDANCTCPEGCTD